MRVFARNDAMVIGIGNLSCGDDAAGLLVARALRRIDADGVRCLAAPTDALGLLADWVDARLVVVVDAAVSGAPAGTVHVLDAHAEPLPGHFRACSSHGFGVIEVIELARALGRLPRRLLVYGIEGRAFAPGDALSPEVQLAVADVVERILVDVRAASPAPAQEENCTSPR